MSLQNERGETTRRNWFSRFSRERLDLSTSVEETLLDEREAIQQDQLDFVDDDRRAGSLKTSQHTNVIAPHFTLQSSPMPVVRTRSASQALDNDEQTIGNIQNSGVFARFAQRFTSSFTTHTNDGRPEVVSPAQEAFDDSSSHLVTSSTRLQSFAEAGKVSKESQILPATNKPNNRPTKIRLETAPEPAVVLPGKEAANEARARATTSDMQSLDLSATIPASSEAGYPFLDLYRLETRDSSMRLPAVNVAEEQARLAKSKREALAGSGNLEAGQREITIENTLITSTTVVLVIMTSNPGPAVVHYVSLLPAVGFTIHLSYPVPAKTSFNYVVLLGELF